MHKCAYSEMVRVEWDKGKAERNRRKHSIEFADAVPVFSDPLAITVEETDEPEARCVTIGSDPHGRVLVVVHAWRGETIRLISARPATRQERRAYQERR
jgi:uncharacterized DUF497 family protein